MIIPSFVLVLPLSVLTIYFIIIIIIIIINIIITTTTSNILIIVVVALALPLLPNQKIPWRRKH